MRPPFINQNNIPFTPIVATSKDIILISHTTYFSLYPKHVIIRKIRTNTMGQITCYNFD